MGPVILADVVLLETTYRTDKPFAREIEAWVQAGQSPGSNAPVQVVETDLGDVYRMALEQNMRTPRGAGEIAITEWLAENFAIKGGPALVIYENGVVPNMLARQGVVASVVVATTRNFLYLAEREGVIEDAEALWRRIIEAAPTPNPASVITFIEPPTDG
jgi:hypothetical protein